MTTKTTPPGRPTLRVVGGQDNDPETQPDLPNIDTSEPQLAGVQALGLTADDIAERGMESLGRIPAMLNRPAMVGLMARTYALVSVALVYDETTQSTRYVPVVLGEIAPEEMALATTVLNDLTRFVAAPAAGGAVVMSSLLGGEMDYGPLDPVDLAGMSEDGPSILDVALMRGMIASPGEDDVS